MKTAKTVSLALLALVALGGAAGAATITSISDTPPPVDGQDIANLVPATGSDLIWGDRPCLGQTFTTGSEGGILNAITVLIQENDGEILGWKDYLIRVGTVTLGNPNTINVQVYETARQDLDVPSPRYYTFTLDSPLPLLPNTLYGFDVGLQGSQEGWQDGIPAVARSGDEFAGGQRYTTAKMPNPGTNVNLASGDLVFHLDIVPEPATLGLLATGGLAMLLRRRRS